MALRRSVGWILLGIFLIHNIGYVVTFLFIQHQLKEDVQYRLRQEITPSSLHLFKISASNNIIYKEALKGEFNMDGQLYDVFSAQTVDDTLHCYCMTDVAEQSLIQKLGDQPDAQYTETQQGGCYHKPISLKNSSWEYYTNSHEKLFFGPSSLLTQLMFFDKGLFNSGHIEVEMPPPRTA